MRVRFSGSGDTAPGRILIAASPRRRRNKWIQGRLIISAGRSAGGIEDQTKREVEICAVCTFEFDGN